MMNTRTPWAPTDRSRRLATGLAPRVLFHFKYLIPSPSYLRVLRVLRVKSAFFPFLLASTLVIIAGCAPRADLILTNGKIITVDSGDRVAQAMAVAGQRIVRVGTNAQVMRTKGPHTQVIDLAGRTVLPGLIDSHTHPTGAAMHEFDHPIPDMQTIADVLAYVRARAAALKKGEWIVVSQVFITRLKERRYPTRQELDDAAPDSPVMFRTGPDCSLNSLAMKLSGIDKDFKPTGPGKVERDPATGEPTGILRNLRRYVKNTEPAGAKHPTEKDYTDRLAMLFSDYNANGITAIADRDASADEIQRYQRMLASTGLSVRISCSHHVDTGGSIESIRQAVAKIAANPLHRRDPMLQIVGTKIFLDGGMLTGSAYMRQPWGVSKIYAIDDPQYRGVLFVPLDKLVPIVRAAVEGDLQFTAHSVGDGAVHTLIEAYDQVSKSIPIRQTRPNITHCNFMSREAIDAMKRLGVSADIQPAWLYQDTRTLSLQFAGDRLRWFQPLHSLFESGVIVGGGSDHMQKIGSMRSVNLYNPWLGMWVTITRQANDYQGPLHREEALTRMQAIRMYTINNAYLTFRDDSTGSLEPGKLADFVVIDTDILTCPVDDIRAIRPVSTYLSGRRVFNREDFR